MKVTKLTEENDDSDFEIDEKGHQTLLAAVADLSGKQRVKPPTRKEPSLQVSEFHLIKSHTDKDAVNVNELTGALGERISYAAIGRKLQSVLRSARTLPKPLEKIEADKIRRKVGFNKVKSTLHRWDAVVHKNRAANTLRFPLTEQRVQLETTNNFLSKFQSKSPLELEIEEILNNSPTVQQERKEEETEFPMSLEEVIQQRKEMAKLRAQQSYREARAARKSKIKSKKYHRIQRREKIKQQLKNFETLQKTDPEAALKQLDQLERVRAEERASLRHKNTGHWARNLAVRAKYDRESRQVLAQQLAISRDLTQKVQLQNSSDEEDEVEKTSTLGQQTDNPWVPEKSETEVDTFVKGYRKYWEERHKMEGENRNLANKVRHDVQPEKRIHVNSEEQQREVDSGVGEDEMSNESEINVSSKRGSMPKGHTKSDMSKIANVQVPVTEPVSNSVSKTNRTKNSKKINTIPCSPNKKHVNHQTDKTIMDKTTKTNKTKDRKDEHKVGKISNDKKPKLSKKKADEVIDCRKAKYQDGKSQSKTGTDKKTSINKKGADKAGDCKKAEYRDGTSHSKPNTDKKNIINKKKADKTGDCKKAGYQDTTSQSKTNTDKKNKINMKKKLAENPFIKDSNTVNICTDNGEKNTSSKMRNDSISKTATNHVIVINKTHTKVELATGASGSWKVTPVKVTEADNSTKVTTTQNVDNHNSKVNKNTPKKKNKLSASGDDSCMQNKSAISAAIINISVLEKIRNQETPESEVVNNVQDNVLKVTARTVKLINKKKSTMDSKSSGSDCQLIPEKQGSTPEEGFKVETDVKANKKKRKRVSAKAQLDAIFDEMEDKMKNNLSKRIKTFKDDLSADEDENGSDNDHAKLELNGPSLEMRTDRLMRLVDEPLLEHITENSPSTSDRNNLSKLLTAGRENTDKPKDSTFEKTSDNIDPNKFLTIKPKRLLTVIPDTLSGGGDDALDDEHDDDGEEAKNMTITEAFADDDVVGEFKQEKEGEAEKSKPQDIDLTLPGWGEWGGKNLPVSRKKKRFIIKTPKVAPRRDENKGNLIINEDQDTKLRDLQIKDIPFPFTSVKEFEESIRAPVGSTWVPQTAHKKLVQPPVETKSGKVIQPMDENVLIDKKKMKMHR